MTIELKEKLSEEMFKSLVQLKEKINEDDTNILEQVTELLSEQDDVVIDLAVDFVLQEEFPNKASKKKEADKDGDGDVDGKDKDDGEQDIDGEKEKDGKDDVDSKDKEDIKESQETPEWAQVKIDMKQDVDAMLEGQEFSDDFRKKFEFMLETVVEAKTKEVTKKLKSKFDAELKDASAKGVKLKEAELTESMDAYLTESVKKWEDKNELALKSQAQMAIFENFMKGMKTLFVENNISIPEGKEDLFQESLDKIIKIEEKLNESVLSAKGLNEEIVSLKTEKVLTMISEGLTDTQKEKLESLSEGVDFETEEDFTTKLTQLKESYFKGEGQDDVSEDQLNESLDSNDPMSKYLNAL